jgi:hypothetical protein
VDDIFAHWILRRIGLRSRNMTEEFERMLNDPDLEAERGPGGTLIFIDGGQYCVVGPDFVSTEESEGHFAHGATREEAIANYSLKRKDR